MRVNYRQTLIDGLWGRLARRAQYGELGRMFIIYEITRLMSER